MRRARHSWLAAVAAALPVVAAALDLPEIERRGELRVLAVDGSPYFLAIGPVEPPGFEREILDGFARLHKLRVRVVAVDTWEALVPAVLEGKGDLAAGGVTATAARRRQIDFSAEVFPTRDVVVTRKPHRVVQSVDQLREERVGTTKGMSFAASLADAGVPAKNVDDGLEATGFHAALQSGRVTALVDGVEDALLMQQTDPAIQIGLFLGPPQSLAFGVRRDNPVLLGALDEYIANTRRTPSWNRLLVKYFGAAAVDVLKKTRGE